MRTKADKEYRKTGILRSSCMDYPKAQSSMMAQRRQSDLKSGGVVDPGKKIRFSKKISDIFRQFHKQK